VIWRKEWGTYRGRNKTDNTIVDGGVLSNFPIRLVADPDADETEIMGKEASAGVENLGMLIDERIDVPGEAPALPSKNKIATLRTVQRISRLIDTMTGASDNEMIRFYAASICHLPAKGYGTLEFDLDGDRLMNFLKAGQSAMIEHLKGRGLYDPAKAPPIT
jgi:predicted acylesterase/phospholipase RssA